MKRILSLILHKYDAGVPLPGLLQHRRRQLLEGSIGGGGGLLAREAEALRFQGKRFIVKEEDGR